MAHCWGGLGVGEIWSLRERVEAQTEAALAADKEKILRPLKLNYIRP